MLDGNDCPREGGPAAHDRPPSVATLIGRAQRCLANGYPPIPVLRHDAPPVVERGGKAVKRSPGKQPHGRLWADKEREVYGATAAKVAAWERLGDIADHPGLGIACGEVAGADIDVYDPELADRIDDLALEMLGPTPLRRVGQVPKRLLVYPVTDGPLAKVQTPELWKGELKAKVEVLGRGQQFVAFGTHPDTREPYAWDGPTPEDTPSGELPAVAKAQVGAFVAAAERLLREAGYRTKAELEAEVAGLGVTPPPNKAGWHAAGSAGPSPFKAINDEAMRRPEAWVQALFPRARRLSSGVWRVSSADLGRDLEEDLSISPAGIVDFGVHDQGDARQGRRTSIDLVIEFGGAADAARAARWLAKRLGVPLEIGRRVRRVGDKGGGSPKGPARAGTAPIGGEPDPEFLRARAGQELADGDDAPGDALLGLSHDGLALDLGEEWADDARHVALWGRWLFWTGAKWEADERLLHMTRAREYLRRRADELVRAARGGGAGVERAEATAKALRSAPTVAHVLGLARSDRGLVATVATWDADPWALNTPAGIVDLRTGGLGPPDPLAYCTKSAAAVPAPPGTPAPLWEAFLARIFRHDPELIGFMRRVLGYALTGLTTEHALVFAWGEGGNGKGVLLNTASRVLGDYAAVAPGDLLLATRNDRHPCDMAMLRGARLVTAQELAPGRAWDEPKLKSLTGGDPVTARFMRQDFFTYEPQFTLFVAGNTKPSFGRIDEAIRRRVLLVPFLQNIPKAERDKDLAARLWAEAPAILRWMIDGCLEWQEQGLNPPESVREASEDYLAAEDVLGQWLGERCVVSHAVGFTQVGVLYADWREWCEEGGLHAGSVKTFSQQLSERGFGRGRTSTCNGFVGVGLKARPWHEEAPGGGSGGCGGSPVNRRTADAPCPNAPTAFKGGPYTSPTNPPEPAEFVF